MGRAARAVLRAGLLILAAARPAWALETLSERDLATVQGRDGLYFNLQNFSLSGQLSLSYASPDGAMLKFGDLAISRTDDPAHLLDDPYALWIARRGTGLADVVHLDLPQNAAGLQRWQAAADLAVTPAGGTPQALGALVLQDLALYGGGVQLSTQSDGGAGSGLVLGVALRADVGALSWRARGRNDGSEALTLSGIHLGAVDASGQFTGQPWALADVSQQPAVLQVIRDGNGGQVLQLKVDWRSSDTGAAKAGLLIDNVRFDSAANGAMDLGSSRISSFQINHMDLRLRPGN
ncbi:hypothetical protein KGA65_12475 [Ideonella sp. B7]|uniref:hypothetical protein n=1 Tax=Ideonella benzenivorans TaxID=2831643 RepID=UPI001CED208B|nr:hypothetical protein [Ideonella benzenivorans]MCA6217357.1 hypothetical protein [Ideonella benzenivorans]